MDINTLIDSLAESIASDTDVLSWSNSTYNRDHQVMVSIDTRTPPGEDECPFVIIYPISKVAGQGISSKAHSIEVDCCIYDDTEDSWSGSNVKGFSGVKRIETFRKLIETAIVKTNIGNGIFNQFDIEYDTIESFPFHWAGMIVDISEDWVTGSDPLE